MTKNFLALVGLWTIVNFIVSALPASFFSVFSSSKAVVNVVETVNQNIKQETGYEFSTRKKTTADFQRKGTSREDECNGIRAISELTNDKNYECQ